VTKSGREIVNILEAFDLTGTAWSAAQLAGCDAKTVARYVAVDGGHRGAVAAAVLDEPAGEVGAVQERAAVGEQGDAGFEGVEASCAGAQCSGQAIGGHGGLRG
jgi:hypothetical protein